MCEMLKSSAKNPRSPQNFRDAALVFAHTGRPQNMAWGEYTLHCYSIVMFHSYVSYAIFMENILFMAGFFLILWYDYGICFFRNRAPQIAKR